MTKSFIGATLGDRDQQSAAHAERMLMARSEFVVVARFEIPAEFVFLRRPKVVGVLAQFSRRQKAAIGFR